MFGVIFWLSAVLIFYTYVGYPLLVWLLARFASNPKHERAEMPFVTLLIAAFNEEAVISQKLENSLALDYPRDKLQILVVDDGSEDRTQEIIRQYQDRGVELAYNPPRRGKMAAINRAMSQARGEIILFSDASNTYAFDVVREIVKPFADPHVGAAVGARSIEAGEGGLGESEGLYWKYESFIQKNESNLGCCTGIIGEVLALRRDLFATPPDGIINDDFYMAMQVARQGYAVAYVPAAKSFESISQNPQDGIERRIRIVAGRYQAIAHAGRLVPWNRPLLVWQIISHKFMRPLVPFFMILCLFSNLLAVLAPAPSTLPGWLGLAQPYGLIFLALQTLFYVLAVGGKIFEKPNSGFLRLFYLPTFLFNSNWAALKGFFRFVSGRQTSLWAKTSKFDSSGRGS